MGWTGFQEAWLLFYFKLKDKNNHLLMVAQTIVPGENHRLAPSHLQQGTFGHIERQRAVGKKCLNHATIGTAPVQGLQSLYIQNSSYH